MRGKGARGASGRVLRAALAALVLAGVGVFHVWSRTRVIAAGYDLARVEAEHRRLVAERDRLRLEVATLRAPGRLERFARARLGMAPPAPGTVVAGVAGGVAAWGGVGGGAGLRSPPAEPVVSSRLALRGPAGRRPAAEGR